MYRRDVVTNVETSSSTVVEFQADETLYIVIVGERCVAGRDVEKEYGLIADEFLRSSLLRRMGRTEGQ